MVGEVGPGGRLLDRKPRVWDEAGGRRPGVFQPHVPPSPAPAPPRTHPAREAGVGQRALHRQQLRRPGLEGQECRRHQLRRSHSVRSG